MNNKENECKHEILVVINKTNMAAQCPLCFKFFPFGLSTKKETLSLSGWVIPGNKVYLKIKELKEKSKNLGLDLISLLKYHEHELNILSAPITEFNYKDKSVSRILVNPDKK